MRRVPIAGLTAAAAGLGAFAVIPAEAQSLPASAFQIYNAADASSIAPGPFSLFAVPVDEIQPGQLNVGFSEIARKIYGWDTLTPSQIQSTLLTDIEPVVIGPGGILVLENGHHTFTSLEDSAYGASDPDVYVDVIANFSNLSVSEFWATMQADDLLLPLNDGVPEVVSATGAPFPTSLQGLTNDPYRGLEESILKNKSSKLFPSASNITGQVGASIPGLDKLTGDFSDFLWADAYRNANGGLGLPYLSPGDIALATQWNLNPNSTTTLPNIGQVTVGQLPGFILNQNITIGNTISNATLSTGTLAANGTFTGITEFNLGTPGNPILVGTPQSGFIMQMGFDSGNSVTLSGNNTYTGGTTIIAGNLIIASDASLGASAPASYTINPNNILGSVEAANGIIFNSEDEGMGTLTIGTSSNGGTFATNRPIAVDGETATLNLNGYQVTLNGQIVSLGTDGDGLGNESGISPLTIDDTSSKADGVLILPANANNSDFYGNWIITAGTLNVSSDAALGNTTGPSYEIGQIELNGGTFQAGASFASTSGRSFFLGGSSSYDTNGFSTSWTGSLTDVQRTLEILNSSTTRAGAVTFGSFIAGGGTATLQLAGGSEGETVTFTNGISFQSGGTLVLQGSTSTSLGTSEIVLSPTQTTTNGIVSPLIVTNDGASKSTGPYDFVTYTTAGGYAKYNYTTFAVSNTTGSTVVDETASQTLSGNASAFALKIESGQTITLGTNTLTIGDGTDPAGLSLAAGTPITGTGGTIAFGGSEAVLWLSNSNSKINSQITGSGGMIIAGSGGLTLSGSSTLTGGITIDSGTLTLSAANYFAADQVVTLADTKSHPAQAVLTVDANNTFAALNSAGNNSMVDIANNVVLTIGDSGNLNSTLSSTIAGSGTGSLVKAGTGLLDISGSNSVSFGSGATVTVQAGALRIGNGVFGTGATTPIIVDAGAELQYSGNGGSTFSDPIQGGGVLHVVGGVVQLTNTSTVTPNNFSGGVVIEPGTTLDVSVFTNGSTAATLPTNANVSNAGGILLFDQSGNGTFSGVMTDGQQAGGPNDPNDVSCTLVSCSGPTLSGTLIKDDSTTGFSGNLTIANQQAYTGMTYIEAGTLTLGAVNTIATSEGVVLGRVGGAVCNPSPCSGSTAILALGADNTIAGLADDPANTTQVQLNGHTLTLAPLAGLSWSYAGSIIDNGASGGLVQNGPGVSIFTGTSTYTGTTTIDAGVLEVDGAITSSSSVAVNSGGTLAGDGTVDPPTVTINAGGTLAPGLPGVPGTSMTIAGNLAFQSGAIYLLQLNSPASTFAVVTGTAALGGTVLADFAPGSNPQRQYTILQAAGLSGSFASVFTNLANFDPSLSTSGNNVLLNVAAALGAAPGLNPNQQSAASAIDDFFNNGGRLPANFLNLYDLTGNSLTNALSQVDGEASTDSERAAFQMMTEFLGLMLDPFVDGRGGGPSGGAMGFAPDRQASLPPDIALAYAGVFKAPQQQTFVQRWTAWGASFGGSNQTNGDPAVGSNNVTTSTYGYAAGMDYHYSPGTVLGFALAGGGTNWDLAQGLGSGRSDAFQAGVYGVTHSGPAYLAAALAFANNWFTTNRTALTDQLTASFSGQSYGGRLEGGYRFAVPFAGSVAGVTPYAALQAQDFHTPSYSETDLTGGGFGLSYDATNGTDTRSELGARFDNPTLLNGRPLILRAQLAWAHDWVSNPALNAAFESLPGTSFTVNGAPIPKNSALTSEEAEWWLNANWSLIAKFDGEFGSGSQTYGGSGTLRYTW